MASPPPSYRGVSPPPPYESRPSSLAEHRSPSPATSSKDAAEQGRASKSPHTNLPEDADSTPAEPSSRRRLSFVQAYKEKRRAKEAARKVDYYERLYGFVPKNVMTEAEWRDARERIPKTKVPFKPRGRGMTAFWLGGVAGGT